MHQPGVYSPPYPGLVQGTEEPQGGPATALEVFISSGLGQRILPFFISTSSTEKFLPEFLLFLPGGLVMGTKNVGGGAFIRHKKLSYTNTLGKWKCSPLLFHPYMEVHSPKGPAALKWGCSSAQNTWGQLLCEGTAQLSVAPGRGGGDAEMNVCEQRFLAGVCSQRAAHRLQVFF